MRPKRTRQQARAEQSRRRREFHGARIASAPTPDHLVEAVRDRVRSLMCAAPADRRGEIAARVAHVLNRIADEEEARLS